MKIFIFILEMIMFISFGSGLFNLFLMSVGIGISLIFTSFIIFILVMELELRRQGYK